MPISLVLAPDLDACCRELARSLDVDAAAGQVDPFAEIPVLTGSSRLDGWVRTHLAHHRGVSAGMAVRPIGAALRAAVDAMTAQPGSRLDRWWEAPPTGGGAPDPWSTNAIALRLIRAWTAADPALDALRDNLSVGPEAARDARQLGLATEVATWLVEEMWRAPGELLAWASTDVAESAWLRFTVQALLSGGDSPAHRVLAALSGEGRPITGPPLRILGVTATDATTRALLERIAADHPVEWYRPTGAPGRWDSAAAPLPAGSAAARLLASEEAERGHLLAMPDLSVRIAESPPSTPSNTLARWQQALREGEAPAAGALPETLPQLIPAWGPRREVEAVRDRLLEAFSTGTYEPRDVLVLTPDLATYGPLVSTLFAERGGAAQWSAGDWAAAAPLADATRPRPPAIPVRLAGLGLTHTNPVAAALLLVLDLCADRVTAPAVHALAILPPVQERFALPPESTADIRTLLEKSGARWGLHGADKARVYGAEAHPNSLAFGLERMALGSLLHDEADVVLALDDASRLAPMPAASRERLPLAGALSALVRALESSRDGLTPASPTCWRERLRLLVDRFTSTSGSLAWLTRAVHDVLDDALVPADDLTLDLEAVRRGLRQRFELPVTVKGAFGSVVAVEPLRPQGITPRPLIVLLGLASGLFPRRRPPPEWAPELTLEHDPVDLQRQAFAEAVLAAGSDLWITWPARELARGRELPPSTPVAELIEILTGSGSARAGWLDPSGRHAWSPGLAPAPTLFEAIATASLQATLDPSSALRPWAIAPSGSRPLPPSSGVASDDASTRELSAFVRDLLNPSQAFLSGRLDIYLEKLQKPMPEREPLELDWLDRWALCDRLLRSAIQGADRSELVRTVVAEQAGQGGLPLEAGADQAVERVLADVDAIAKVLKRAGGDRRLRDVPIQARLGEGEAVLEIVGTVPEVLERGEGQDRRQIHQWVSASEPDEAGRLLLGAWIALCVARSQGHPVEAARLVGKKKGGKDGTAIWLGPKANIDGEDTASAWLSDQGQALAKTHLKRLAWIWWQARCEPLLLFKNSSYALAKALGTPPAQIAAKVTSEWLPGYQTTGDSEDRWVATLHPGLDPGIRLTGSPHLIGPLSDCERSTDIVALARVIWEPLRRSRLTEARDAFGTSSPLRHWKVQS